MSIFKRKKLLKRVESLESYLGLHYVVDSDGYNQHVPEDNQWSTLNRIKADIEELREKVFKRSK